VALAIRWLVGGWDNEHSRLSDGAKSLARASPFTHLPRREGNNMKVLLQAEEVRKIERKAKTLVDTHRTTLLVPRLCQDYLALLEENTQLKRQLLRMPPESKG